MKKKILIIDDETDFTNLLAWALRFSGYEVVCCDRGDMAFDSICRTVPDLIMLDINLPDISGLEVYNRIRANREVKQIPIVFLSALHERESYCTYFLKADGFLKKPCDKKIILETIEKILKKNVKKQGNAPVKNPASPDCTSDSCDVLS